MGNNTTWQLEQAKAWFRDLRDRICDEFIRIEREYDPAANHLFKRSPWNRKGGGGGEMSIMYGQVFEKVGVNISTVYGTFSEKFVKEIPGALENDGKFAATGISLVAHMQSPLIPAIHMNTRFITTKKAWFGGGIDLTPMYYNSDDYHFFHKKLEELCKDYDYAAFKKNADEYFYLKHRKESRGIGGIFYDYLNSHDWSKDFLFTKEVGNAFLSIYPALVRKYMNISYSPEQRQYQLFKRGRYVEFNLLYDRGTRFGLMTDGNSNAIMMSMPPSVKWDAGEALS